MKRIRINVLYQRAIERCDRGHFFGRLPRYCNEIHSPLLYPRIFATGDGRRVVGFRPVRTHKLPENLPASLPSCAKAVMALSLTPRQIGYALEKYNVPVKMF
jgi:hypothetical protein